MNQPQKPENQVEILHENAKTWRRHYLDKAFKTQKCKQAYIEQEKEVARLRELLSEFYDTLDIGGYHHSLCNIQTEDPDKWDLGCNCEIADLKKRYIELMSTAPAPEETTIEREEPLYIIGNSWSR